VAVIAKIEDAETTDHGEHETTRKEISELQEALRLLSEQMEASGEELKSLLHEFNHTTNEKKRRHLGQRSNAVTAALLALEIVYRSILVSISFTARPVSFTN
jgi:molecular chaperone GrpE (heat shock protein)